MKRSWFTEDLSPLNAVGVVGAGNYLASQSVRTCKMQSAVQPDYCRYAGLRGAAIRRFAEYRSLTMKRAMIVGLVLAWTWSGPAVAQSRNEQTFGPWALTTIVDEAGGPTRAILSIRQQLPPEQRGRDPSLTFRCRSDEPAKMDAIFGAQASLTSQPTHPVTFHFSSGSSLTQTWTSTNQYGTGLNGSAYNNVVQDLTALLIELTKSQQLTVHATEFIGVKISSRFTIPAPDTENAVRATLSACSPS